jgi:predicted heme/steroid binding protein
MTGRHTRPVLLLAVAVLVLAFAAGGCGGSATETTTSQTSGPSTTATTERQFTLVELAEFDGLDGRPAYVAVDGIVYDVSDSARWPQGSHSSCNLGASAGRDLSDVIRQAPASMRALLEGMPVVGSLAQ